MTAAQRSEAEGEYWIGGVTPYRPTHTLTAIEAAQLVLGGDRRAGPVCDDCDRPATEHKLTGWYCADHAPGAVARARGAA